MWRWGCMHGNIIWQKQRLIGRGIHQRPRCTSIDSRTFEVILLHTGKGYKQNLSEAFPFWITPIRIWGFSFPFYFSYQFFFYRYYSFLSKPMGTTAFLTENVILTVLNKGCLGNPKSVKYLFKKYSWESSEKLTLKMSSKLLKSITKTTS